MRNKTLLLLIFYLFSVSLFAKNIINQKININTALKDELIQLPLISETKANAIINYRKIKPIKSEKDIIKVKGINYKTLNAIKPYIKFSNDSIKKSSKKQQTNKTTNEIIAIKTEQIRILTNQEYFPTVLKYIQNAEKEIVITMFVFKISTSKNNKVNILVEALIKAKARGVKILVILENSQRDEMLNEYNHYTAKKLIGSGIQVIFDSIKKTTHSKIIIIDNQFVFIGSHNLTHSAMSYNNEISILMNNKVIAKKVLNYIKKIKSQN